MTCTHNLRRFPGQTGESGESPTAATRLPAKKPVIKVAEPYPLLDPGEYVALCTEATYEWAKQFGAWKVRLLLEPQDYTGRPYSGRLCKFLNLGKDASAPYAGPRSAFRMLLVDVNGEQPTRPDFDDLSIFVKRLYKISVETVTKSRRNEPPAPEHHYSIVREIHPLKLSAPLNPRNLGNSGNLGNLLTDQPSNLVNPPLGKSSVSQSREARKDEFG